MDVTDGAAAVAEDVVVEAVSDMVDDDDGASGADAGVAGSGVGSAGYGAAGGAPTAVTSEMVSVGTSSGSFGAVVVDPIVASSREGKVGARGGGWLIVGGGGAAVLVTDGCRVGGRGGVV